MKYPGHNQSLLKALLAGSPSAFEKLRKHLRSALHGLRADVEEIVEDCIVEVYEAARSGEIEDDAQLLIRAREILRNIVRRRTRSKTHETPADWLDDLAGPAGETMEDRLRWWERLDRIAAALRGMERVLFYLIYECGADSERICVWLSITPESLRKKKERLVRKIRHTLREEPELRPRWKAGGGGTGRIRGERVGVKVTGVTAATVGS